MQWLRFRRWLLGIKGIPKHILALLLFSLPFVIAMTLVTIMTSSDHRERTTPFRDTRKVSCPTKNIWPFFLVAINMFFSLIPPCIFCTLARLGGQLHRRSRHWKLSFRVVLPSRWKIYCSQNYSSSVSLYKVSCNSIRIVLIYGEKNENFQL